jgi:hypothetical protein
MLVNQADDPGRYLQITALRSGRKISGQRHRGVEWLAPKGNKRRPDRRLLLALLKNPMPYIRQANIANGRNR